MMKRNHLLKTFLLLSGDLMLLYGALISALLLRYAPEPNWPLINQHYLPFAAVFALWLILFGAFGLYDLRFTRNNKRFFYRLLRAMITNAVLTIFIFYLLPFLKLEPRRNLFIITFFAAVFIAAWRYLFNLFIIRAAAARVLFLGVSKETAELANYLLKHPQLGQKPAAFMSGDGEPEDRPLPPLPYFVSPENIIPVIQDESIDTIVISREIKENKVLVNALFQVIPLGIGVVEFPAFYEMFTGKIPLSLIGEIWFLENLVGIKKRFYEFFKRGLDIICALILGVPSLLMFPLIALSIKLDSEGPVFFRQKRTGRHGKEFWFIKYRSMIKDADKLGGFKQEGNDLRHTNIGKLLRKSYLDELPQIINILKGEMSFVGPRPERPEYVQGLKQKIPFYEMRLLVPPGITGWAQINMENDASVEDAPEKMQYDLYYIKNRSFILDLLIILRTVFTILRRQGR